jgi:hypothetical protein
MIDLRLAENELAGLDKYMTDEHYSERRDRARMFLRNAIAIVTHTVDADISVDLLDKT